MVYQQKNMFHLLAARTTMIRDLRPEAEKRGSIRHIYRLKTEEPEDHRYSKRYVWCFDAVACIASKPLSNMAISHLFFFSRGSLPVALVRRCHLKALTSEVELIPTQQQGAAVFPVYPLSICRSTAAAHEPQRERGRPNTPRRRIAAAPTRTVRSYRVPPLKGRY